MKKQEWNEGLDHLDPELVEEYVEQKDLLCKKKRWRAVWIRVGAIAACMVLIVGTIIFPNLSKTSIPIDTISPPSSKPTSAPKYYGSESSIGSSSDILPEFISSGLSVTARLIETLPGTYTFYDDWGQQKYRILRMKTEKLLGGAEMTDEFYYLIPIEFMTDFSIYDSFVIKDMAQFGYEYSVVYNKTQGKAEQLPLVLFGYRNYGYQLMGENFLAFNALGVFDSKLWTSNQAWKDSTENAEHPLTIKKAEDIILEEQLSGWQNNLFVHKLDDVTGEAAEALAYIRAFENGIYVPKISSTTLFFGPEVQFQATRYINGFATNETLNVWGKDWTPKNIDIYEFSKARFTKEDLENLPDLNSAFDAVNGALKNGTVKPPNFRNNETIIRTTNAIFGWYAKTENGVIGIIRVNWSFRTKKYKTYYDDAYYIIESGSDECKEISRDALLKKLGEYETTYIFDGKYDKNGKIFDEVIFCA